MEELNYKTRCYSFEDIVRQQNNQIKYLQQEKEELHKQVEWHQKYNKEASDQLIKSDEKEIKIIKYCKENVEKLEIKLHDEIITQSDSERSFYRGMLSAYLDTLRQLKKKEKEGVGIE